MWFFYYFNFERNYDVLKSKKSPYILLNKNICIIKTKRNRKWKTPGTVLGRRTVRLNKTVIRWRFFVPVAFLYHLFCPKEIFRIVLYLNV